MAWEQILYCLKGRNDRNDRKSVTNKEEQDRTCCLAFLHSSCSLVIAKVGLQSNSQTTYWLAKYLAV